VLEKLPIHYGGAHIVLVGNMKPITQQLAGVRRVVCAVWEQSFLFLRRLTSFLCSDTEKTLGLL
jgi:hypothetical protein